MLGALQRLQGLKFSEAFSANARIILRQGRQGHESDFIRNGELRVSRNSDCSKPSKLKAISLREETWEGKLEGILCLDIALVGGQQEWISIREIVVLSLSNLPETTTSTQGLSDNSSERRQAQYSLQHALLAAIVGFSAGAVAWLAVCTCSCICPLTEKFGAFSSWTLTFLLALDALVYFCLRPFSIGDEPDAAAEIQRSHKEPVSRPVEASESQWPCPSGSRRQPNLSLDWHSLSSGIRSIDPLKLRHLGPGTDPRSEPRTRAFLSVGLVLDSTGTEAVAAASAVSKLLEAGGSGAILGILIAHVPQALSARRQEMIQQIQAVLGRLGAERQALVHLLDPSPDFYPELPARWSNIDLALLVGFLKPLAETFMSLDSDCPMAQDYPELIRRHTSKLESKNIPWISTHFSRQGHKRKLIRSNLLHRWMEARLRLGPY